MKKRLDFVTNSSSSSYVCEICNRSEVVDDYNFADAGFIQCQEWHTYCPYHGLSLLKQFLIDLLSQLIDDPEFEDHPDFNNNIQGDIGIWADDLKTVEAFDPENDSAYDDFMNLVEYYTLNNDVPPKYCPICTMQSMSKHVLALYLLKKNETTEETILKEIQNNFLSYDDLLKYIVKKE